MVSLLRQFVQQLVSVMTSLKQDTMMLGHGPFDGWSQLSSGAHGALLMSAMCDQVCKHPN